MRIVSGKYKGRRFSPSGLKHTRPTTDFAREGLFNILNSQLDLDDLQVLDLFSGSGAVAFEFESRGAQRVISVERDTACVKFIHQYKGELGMEHLEVIKSDALRYLAKTPLKFDLIFADPPYGYDNYAMLLQTIFERNLITDNGMLIIEHDKNEDFQDEKTFVSKRNFGNVHFSFFSIS